MTDKIQKEYVSKLESTDDRVIRFVGSTEGVDRDGDLIPIKSWDIDRYKANPVVLVNHMRPNDAVSYAKTINVWVDELTKNLMFDIEFPPAHISAVGDSLYKYFKWAGVGATSVGFITDYSAIEYVGKDERPDGARRILNKNELLEISLVSTPANAQALMVGKSFVDAKNANVLNQEELDGITKHFGGVVDEVALLKSRIAELELELQESKMNDNDDNLYTNLFEKLTGQQATEKDEHTDGHTVDSFDVDYLNNIYKKDK